MITTDIVLATTTQVVRTTLVVLFSVFGWWCGKQIVRIAKRRAHLRRLKRRWQKNCSKPAVLIVEGFLFQNEVREMERNARRIVNDDGFCDRITQYRNEF